ncbi:hypothetical protein AMECASPLE_031352 [Ameca splendens]|uniref:Uncharacterized protein n=1 Tax=Ameca splendens TaxID=208324 RepID=A0ABV0YTB4_9TELE
MGLPERVDYDLTFGYPRATESHCRKTSEPESSQKKLSLITSSEAASSLSKRRHRNCSIAPLPKCQSEQQGLPTATTESSCHVSFFIIHQALLLLMFYFVCGAPKAKLF